MKKKIFEINVTIDNKEDIYNHYDKNQLSHNLGKYIYNQGSLYDLNKKVEINLELNDHFSDEEKENIKFMIKEYFKSGAKEMSTIVKEDRIKKILLFLLGIVLIIISHFVSLKDNFVISEIFLIVGWVSIWEVFDNILFKETKQYFRLNLCKKLSNCKINIK